MKALDYPFDSSYILKKKKSLRRELLSGDKKFIEKKIAILGGVTTSDITLILELFLLNQGIKPTFYESEYNKYWEDATFDNPELKAFQPDIIYICTSWRNVISFPDIADSSSEVAAKLSSEFERFSTMWDKLFADYHCTIIQNNFEFPTFRLLGNKDATDIHGKVNFLTQLNLQFADYAEAHENFFICDINYASALYGLEQWSDPFYWYMYKYATAVPAIPTLSFQVANIIKAILGKNKKGFVLDLDNTLWGGIVGDDGVENLEIGQETATAEAFTDFQQYLKDHTKIGILLNVNSKNDEANALAGLRHADGILRPEDFISIKANWEPKSHNFAAIASELNLGADSLVFVDDNPAERAIINQDLPDVSTPEISEPYNYLNLIDHNSFFELVNISSDDLKKQEMYRENAKRAQAQSSFKNYDDYLKSLKMTATIAQFIPLYHSRIAQLSNKSNQFNLTTRRYTQSEVEAIASDHHYLTLYGKLEDKFGDNGVVTVVIGHQDKTTLHLDLWIMSCRVLKRDMELATMDALIKECQARGIKKIYGYYYPTPKNGMVKDFYPTLGFKQVKQDKDGNTTYEFAVTPKYVNQNKFIKVKEDK